MRIGNWSKMSSAELWAAWRAGFSSLAEAEASAIWIANRLVKGAARSTRRRFYQVKDIFLEEYSHSLIQGYRVRQEGRGTLYLHVLEIAETRYSLHSYRRPRLLSDKLGEDKESYGGRFTDEEIKLLKLPLSGLVRMLRWHTFAEGIGERRRGKESGPSDVGFNCHCKPWPRRSPGRHHEQCRRKAE